MPFPTVNCHCKSSFAHPNQPGLTSPDKPPPYPKNFLFTKRPSLNSRSRPTNRRSKCPQGCVQYQAKVTSGAPFLAGSPASTQPPAAATVTPFATQAAVPVFETAPGTKFVSCSTSPAGVSTSVSGASAENDNALPHGPVMV